MAKGEARMANHIQMTNDRMTRRAAGLRGRGWVLGGMLGLLGVGVAMGAAGFDEVIVEGTGKMKRGDFEGAIRVFDRAVEMEPGRVEGYLMRALVKQMKGDLDGALADAERAIALNGKLAKGYMVRGAVRMAKGELEAARKDCDVAVGLDEQDGQTYGFRAAVRMKQNDWAGALEDLDRALVLDPKDGSNLRARAVLKTIRGDLEGAVADYEKAVANEPREGKWSIEMGGVKEKQGKWWEAVADYTRGLQLDPSAEGYLGRGQAQYEGKRWGEAEGDFRKYCGFLKGDSVHGRLMVWAARSRKGERKEADKELAEALAGIRPAKGEEWAWTMGAYLAGKGTEEEVLKAVEPVGEGMRGEAYYFLGVKGKLEGDAGAAEWFKKSAKAGVKGGWVKRFSEMEVGKEQGK